MLKVLTPLLVVTFMFQAGLDAAQGSRRRLPLVAIGRGLLLMLVLGPLVAWALVHLVPTTPEVAVGLIVLSVTGVMPLASRGARDLGGSTTTAVLLTIVLAQITVLTALPSAEVLLARHGGAVFASGPAFVQVLLLQWLPLMAGILVARRAPARSAPLSRFISVLDKAILTVVVVVVVLPKLGVVTVLGLRGVLLTSVFAIALAVLSALIGGPTTEDRRAILSVTAAANLGLSLTMLKSAGLEDRFGPTLMAIFLVRVLVGTLTQKALVRGAARGHDPLQQREAA